MKLIPALLVLVLSVLSLSSCNTPGATSQAVEPPPSKLQYKIGETAAIEDNHLKLAFTVNGVREHGGIEFLQPQEGHKWLLVNTTIINHGKKAEAISLAEFQLADGEGKIYEADIFDGALTDVTSILGQIEPGGERQGSISFEIPRNVQDLKLIFHPNRVACNAFSDDAETTLVKKKLVEASFNCTPIAIALD